MGNYPENHDFGDEFPEFGSSLKPELARAALLTLTQKERVVLSHRCQGKLLKQIAKELKVSQKAIEYHLGNIYQKLRLDQEGWGYNERKYYLLKNYCPVLRELIKEKNEEAVTEISEPLGESLGEIIQLDPKIQAIIQMESEIEATMDEDKPVKIEVPPQPPIVIRTQTPPIRPKRRYGWIFWLVIILAVGVGAFFLGQRLPNIFSPSTPTSKQQGGASLTPSTQALGDTLKPTEAEQGVPISTPEPPTDTSAPTDTPTDTLVLTDTPVPTATITPKPTPVVLFEDNFENGQLPDWQIPPGQPGNYYFIDNTLQVEDPAIWFFVGEKEWKNYQVTIDGNVNLYYGPGIYAADLPSIFVVRVVDQFNMVGVQVSEAGYSWVLMKDGVFNRVSGSEVGGGGGQMTIIITVTGNEFRFNINGVEGKVLNISDYPNGNVGMYLGVSSSVDNFKVVELP